MKLLFITRRIDPLDAVAGFSYSWVLELARQVDWLYVICLEQGKKVDLPTNCQIFSLGKEHGKNRWREFWRLQRLAQNIIPQVDCVFTHQNPEYGIAVALWTKMFHKKLVAWYAHKSVTLRLRLLELLADRIFSASKESFRLDSAKLVIIHHGIDLAAFPFRPKKISSEFRLLSVSRISASKHVEMIIDLLRDLRQRSKASIVLEIVGEPVVADDKKYFELLNQQVKKLGLNDAVFFSGPVPYGDIKSKYYQADIFVNCSSTGSLDKAVLESMLCGTLTLTTNEAFRSLPIYTADYQALLKKCEDLVELTERQPLLQEARSYAEKHHSLDNLISRIIQEINRL